MFKIIMGSDLMGIFLVILYTTAIILSIYSLIKIKKSLKELDGD